MKKFMSVVSIVMVIILALAGCNSSTTTTSKSDVKVLESGYPIVEEPIVLKMFGTKTPGQGEWADMKVFKKMEELTNISFEFITPPKDSITEKKGLTFAGDDLPDFFFCVEFSPTEEMKYGGEGLIVPLEEYIEKWCPNIKKMLDENPEIRKDITAPDGHIYGLPEVNLSKSLHNRMFINKKWLDALGLQIPKTIDEFVEVLRHFKNNDPNKNGKTDEIPFAISGMWQYNWLAGLYGMLPHDNGIWNNDGTMVYTYTDDRYKEFLKWWNLLYEEGLLDPDSLTQNTSQLRAKGSDGILGAFFSSTPTDMVGEDKSDWYEYQPVLEGPNGDKMWVGYSPVREFSTFVMTKANKYPEATMRWIDYFYGDEACTLFNDGVEGEDYVKRADGMYERVFPSDKYNNYSEYKSKELTPAGTLAVPLLIPANRNEWNEKFDITGFSAWKYNNDTNIYVPYEKERYPRLYFSESENRDMVLISSDLTSYVDNMRIRFISGDSDIDANWDEFCKRAKELGADKITKIYQNALDSRK